MPIGGLLSPVVVKIDAALLSPMADSGLRGLKIRVIRRFAFCVGITRQICRILCREFVRNALKISKQKQVPCKTIHASYFSKFALAFE